ncbi:histone H2B-like [Neodiprion fabricii]|uniref:histone H2B-like n=1 Tax=Neodiprion fabricii TaxID=2872261 RepID=UPI001ED8C8D7|nr:histone H2B-like [Neodiprion fabricii]XP_046434308.1 histone H2B-like [Neodiprion fabricii]
MKMVTETKVKKSRKITARNDAEYITSDKQKNKNNKKKKRRKPESYARYIYRVMKINYPYIGISVKAMSIMDSFMKDMFERFAEESSRLAHYNKRSTITDREIKTAVKFILPGELAIHAIHEGNKALTKYEKSKQPEVLRF